MQQTCTKSPAYGLLLGLAVLAAIPAASAQETTDQVIRATRSTTFSVPIYKSRVVDLPQFADGFEFGDTCAWSGTVGDGCL